MKKILILISILTFTISCISVNNKEYVYKEHKNITLGFKNNKIYGYTGINVFNGNYEIKDGKLIVNHIGITLASSSPEKVKIEREFLDLLNYNKKIIIKNNGIKIIDKNGKIHIFSETFK